MRGSWLCPTDLDRARVLESGPRVRRAREISSLAIGVALLASAPFVGWWVLGLFALSVVNLKLVDPRLARAARPERIVAATLLRTELIIAAAVVGSGGPRSPFLPWLVIPTALNAARFRPQVVLAGLAGTAVVVAAVCFGVDTRATLAHPAVPLAVVALLVSVVAIVEALESAELHHRDEAVLDPLTGLLNRKALEARFAELSSQAELTDGSVCLVLVDLDHFKQVNDEHGHDRGDAVLRDFAYEMRKGLRAFELIYRLGGEEFLVVLPGASLADGTAIAERLRAHVSSQAIGGLDITFSAGVSAQAGAALDWESLYRDADEALYRAKREGRNAVCTAQPVPEVLLEAALRGLEERALA